MSTRTRILLTAMVFAVAAVMCALPSVWPAYMHLIGTGTYQDYQLEVVGFMAGWVTKDALSRHRRVRPSNILNKGD